MRRAVIDATGGHDSVDELLMGLFSGEDRKEAFAPEIGGRGATSGLDEGGEKVKVFDHGRVHRSGFDVSRPPGDESGLEPVVVASPLGKGEGVALFGGDDKEGVAGEAILFNQFHGLADL